MRKQDYINAINEIKPSEELKKKTLNKIHNKKKNNFRIIKYVVSFALICICVMIGIKETDIEQIKPEIASEKIDIPTLTFEEVHEIGKKQKDFRKTEYLEDSVNQEVAEEGKYERSDKNYSKTNVQVNGIDEMDFIKQDGEYIYYAINKKVVIVDVKDINNPVKISEIKLEDNQYINGIYVYKNKLIIIKNEYETKTINIGDKFKEIYSNRVRNYTEARIYDITDKKNPKEERSVDIEGGYCSSRLQNGKLYLITNQYIYGGGENVQEDYYKPTYRDSFAGAELKYINYDRIYKLQNSNVVNYTLIGKIDLEDNKQTEIQTFFGRSNDIYMSENNLYIANINYLDEKQSTTIYKFNIKSENLELIAKGEVEGSILNQFSMDEYNNNFRIATNQILNNETKYINTVYVLNEKMEEIGKLTDIANGEDMKAVRFDEKRAFVVTYKDIDPLFVINMENPTDLKILGELKIPGYSKYLEVYDETHLLGIGEDTKQTKTGERRDGIKVTMFDISDVNNPKELSTVKIDDRYAFSEVLYNHRALLNVRSEGIISFPVNYSQNNKQGAIVINVNEDKMLEEKGRITHVENKRDYFSDVKRILYNNGKLITVSEKYLQINDSKSLEKINKIEL